LLYSGCEFTLQETSVFNFVVMFAEQSGRSFESCMPWTRPKRQRSIM